MAGSCTGRRLTTSALPGGGVAGLVNQSLLRAECRLWCDAVLLSPLSVHPNPVTGDKARIACDRTSRATYADRILQIISTADHPWTMTRSRWVWPLYARASTR